MSDDLSDPLPPLPSQSIHTHLPDLPNIAVSSPGLSLRSFDEHLQGMSNPDEIYPEEAVSDETSSNYSREYAGGRGHPSRGLGFERPLDSLSPTARLKSCDVYVGLHGRNPSLIRFVNWLRAELEMHGVSCFVSDRSGCVEAYAHRVAKVAMDAASFGVVVITERSFSNPYSIEEIRVFLEKKNLIPIFFGLGQGECIAKDIIEKSGEVWEKYGGLQEEWKEAVDGLSRADVKLEANEGNLRDCILEAVILLGIRLGRRSVVEKVKKWKEWVEKEEYPFPRNVDFVGRKKELLELELFLFGDIEGGGEDECIELRTGRRRSRKSRSSNEALEERAAKQSEDRMRKGKKQIVWSESEEEVEMHGVWSEKGTYHFPRGMHVGNARKKRSTSFLYGKGVACVSGGSGIGKTELLLEFAYRFSQRYKMILWVSGEARYIRQNYMNLLPVLGVDVSIENELCPERNGSRSFEGIEEDTIHRVRKELMRDIPFLLVIDNLEREKDWWDGNNIMELLPRFGGETHVLISTRLPRVMNIEPLRLLYLSGVEAISLMKGSLGDLSTEGLDALKVIDEKLGRLPLGLALVGAILSELPIDPPKLLDTINGMPYRELSWSGSEDLVLRRNPFLVQLLDVCFLIFDLADKHKSLAMRMVQASGWFAPSSIPISLLALAAREVPEKRHGAHFWRKCLRVLTCMCMESDANRSDVEASTMLVRFRIARSSNKIGCICFHDVIKTYARKIGNVGVARALVRAIVMKGSLRQHPEHIWAACFLLFKFGTDPRVVDLTIPDLLLFIKRFALPLAMNSFTSFSRCSAALELLRVSTEALEAVENSFLSEANNAENGFSCLRSSTGQSTIEPDPLLYQDFAHLRATLLETRAKLMLRGGWYDIGEQLCRTAVSIKEVLYGWEHPETLSTRETMARLLSFQSKV